MYRVSYLCSTLSQALETLLKGVQEPNGVTNLTLTKAITGAAWINVPGQSQGPTPTAKFARSTLIPAVEQVLEASGSTSLIQQKRKGKKYFRGRIRNKGIKGPDLMRKTLRAKPGAQMKDIVATFKDKTFKESSARTYLSKMISKKEVRLVVKNGQPTKYYLVKPKKVLVES